MEDFQEQEYEFLRRLEEERSDRRTLLRRGVGAGVGLTILSLSPAAMAARKQATGQRTGPRQGHHDQGVRRRGQEGRPAQHDRPAARLGELRRDHVDLLEEVRHPHHERQPRRLVGGGERGRAVAQG